MIKLIATDMDGTFLDSDKRFDPEFIDIFYKLKEKGIKFVIASGNQYYRLYQKFLPLSEQMYFIAENGCYIAEGATELYCNTITHDNVELIKTALAPYDNLFMIMCGRKGAYVLSRDKHFESLVRLHYCNYQFVDSFDHIDDEIMKISINDPEEQIEKYLREEAPDVEAFLKIFAWKTNKIDQKQSLCKKDIVYIAGEDKKKNWNFNKKDRVASAVTRHGLIEKETVKKENGEEETKTLYDFLNTAVDLSKSYRSLKENDKKEKQQKFLEKLTIASLKGIGSVYLITFMYFITQGEMRIYDIFAMMALDAIYPSNVQDELSFGSLNSLYIGANVKPRDLPQKDQLGFKNLFSDNKRYNKTYQIYIKKLNQFVEDYNKELPEGQKVTYEKCRDIDRALWVYGHFFQ